MQHNTNAMPKVVEDCHELLAWIIPKLDHFPRNRRYMSYAGRDLQSRSLHFVHAVNLDCCDVV